jgi:hypothetical protein
MIEIMLQYLVFLAAGAILLSAYAYVKSMLKGNVKPNRVTWLLWAIAPMISFAASVSNGTGLAAVPVFAAGLSPLLIFVASFAIKKAHWKLVKLDYACGLLSALAIFFWAVTSDPDTAIMLAILSDALASIPTFKKGWQYPETESAWPFLTGLFGGLTSFLAITAWTFSQYAFPAYLVIANIPLFSIISRKTIFTYFRKKEPDIFQRSNLHVSGEGSNPNRFSSGAKPLPFQRR